MRQQSSALQVCEAPELAAPYREADRAALPPLPARFLLHDGRELSCEVVDPGISGALFRCTETVSSGAHLIAYVEGLGRLEGIAGEAAEGGFLVHFALKGARLARLAQTLDWLRLRQLGLASEERRGTRFQPGTGVARVTFGGGEDHACEVLDISLSGAAIRCGVRPEPGSCVWLGKTRGRVIRHMADGFAIEFLAPLEQGELHDSLG
jgi:hypothetical protein